MSRHINYIIKHIILAGNAFLPPPVWWQLELSFAPCRRWSILNSFRQLGALCHSVDLLLTTSIMSSGTATFSIMNKSSIYVLLWSPNIQSFDFLFFFARTRVANVNTKNQWSKIHLGYSSFSFNHVFIIAQIPAMSAGNGKSSLQLPKENPKQLKTQMMGILCVSNWGEHIFLPFF